jgi:hypothetical protein
MKSRIGGNPLVSSRFFWFLLVASRFFRRGGLAHARSRCCAAFTDLLMSAFAATPAIGKH